MTRRPKPSAAEPTPGGKASDDGRLRKMRGLVSRRRRSGGGSSALTAVRDILRHAAHTLGIEPAVHLVEAREAWAGIVGPGLARASRVLSLRGGVLVVAAAHPLAAQELRWRREDILAAIGQRVAGTPRRLQVVIRWEGKMAETPTETGF